MELIAMDEGGEAKVGEAGGGDEGELDHNVIGTVGGGVGEDKVGGNRVKDTLQEEEGSGDNCMPTNGLVEAHLPEIGLTAPKLIISMGEVVCETASWEEKGRRGRKERIKGGKKKKRLRQGKKKKKRRIREGKEEEKGLQRWLLRLDKKKKGNKGEVEKKKERKKGLQWW
ncbi:hypothetical protein B296_00041601 [Ensete ventricosum]|uniref:Uncharacterized protein n=1 Tax=Ensete ventricosum TaxID=4639 RepID=A0A426Z5B8_ENSVE|nr:hypothetical protein B296_00041601 [Ensete ventricosum]